MFNAICCTDKSKIKISCDEKSINKFIKKKKKKKKKRKKEN